LNHPVEIDGGLSHELRALPGFLRAFMLARVGLMKRPLRSSLISIKRKLDIFCARIRQLVHARNTPPAPAAIQEIEFPFQ